MAERLTDRGIAALKPSDKAYIIFDSEVSGFGVRVYPSGRKVLIFDWRDKNRKQSRKVIGAHPVWTVGRGRIAASKMRLKADTGESIMPERGMRVAELITPWKQIVRLTRRPATVQQYLCVLDRYVIPVFGRSEPRAITRNAVEHWHATIAQTAPVMANRAMAVLSSFLTWCEHDGKVERNVIKGAIRKRPENARHIFLSADEITAAHAALDADPSRNAALALRMALLTGARIGEVLSLAEGQIDSDRKIWVKPASGTKQRRTHVSPLSAEALDVARQLLRLGLPCYDTCLLCWGRVKLVINRPDVLIHDLRHSRASALARNGASLPMIGKVLGHSSATTTARYAHLVSDDLRALVERTS